MIKCLRMTTGEDVIGEVDENVGDQYEIRKAVQVMLGMTPDGNTGVKMAPFPIFAQADKVTVPKQAVAFEYEPNSEIRNLYSSRFGSGIVVPQLDAKKLLLET